MLDSTAQTFGLPPCLLIPIAARSVQAIEKYVGSFLDEKRGRDGSIKALLVTPFAKPDIDQPQIQLWKKEQASEYFARLHPDRQVWVHVDYRAYRKAYLEFGMPDISDGYVLDHIQNREAVRLKGYSHPYIRLCPVSRRVNTSGGHSFGGEGLEKEFLKSLPTLSAEAKAAFEKANASQITYADPMDLCKMLDLPPGTETLSGVADIHWLIYPASN